MPLLLSIISPLVKYPVGFGPGAKLSTVVHHHYEHSKEKRCHWSYLSAVATGDAQKEETMLLNFKLT